MVWFPGWRGTSFWVLLMFMAPHKAQQAKKTHFLSGLLQLDGVKKTHETIRLYTTNAKWGEHTRPDFVGPTEELCPVCK